MAKSIANLFTISAIFRLVDTMASQDINTVDSMIISIGKIASPPASTPPMPKRSTASPEYAANKLRSQLVMGDLAAAHYSEQSQIMFNGTETHGRRERRQAKPGKGFNVRPQSVADAAGAAVEAQGLAGGSLGENTIPINWNWAEHGRVTRARDQKTSTTCWAFALAGCLEGSLLRENPAAFSNETDGLSEQYLLDCNHDWTGPGATSMFETPVEFVKAKGIPLRSAYGEYTGVKGSCTVPAEKNNALKDYNATLKMPKKTGEEELKHMVFANGPIAIGLYASPGFDKHKGWDIYAADEVCEKNHHLKDINHAVLVVGFGVDAKSNISYWIIKNSAGPEWGQNGFARLLRDKGFCSIGTYARFVTLHPKSVEQIAKDQQCDGGRCGCERGRCYKRPLYYHPAMSKRELWCFTQELGSKTANQLQFAECKRHDECSWAMLCADCVWYRADEGAFSFVKDKTCLIDD